MKKISVQTTGSFMLLDRFSRAEILPGVVVEVPLTEFIAERLALGQLLEVTLNPEPVKVESVEPVATKVGTPPQHPLDHDGDGKPGGSLPGPRKKRTK